MNVTRLYLYPVKSCAGIPVDHATVTPRGFELDRRYMLVDAEGRFLSQRRLPRMALIQTALAGETLRLEGPDGSPFELPTELGRPAPTRSKTQQTQVRPQTHVPPQTHVRPQTQVQIWKHRVAAMVHEEGSRWFSDQLRTRCQLVYMPDTVRRPIDAPYGRTADFVSFADGFPFLLTSESSLDDLNQRIRRNQPAAERIDMIRFRPNIVVSSSVPYAEDGWEEIRLGTIPFRAPKPCTRCTITTVNPANGKRGHEPLRTLATYRRRDGHVWFGTNLIPDATGTMRVGDVGEVLQSRPEPL